MGKIVGWGVDNFAVQQLIKRLAVGKRYGEFYGNWQRRSK